MRGFGFVPVGVGTRISWHTKRDPVTLLWLVAGRDQREVITLAMGMRDLVGVWDGPGEATGGVGQITWDPETEMWVVRGNVMANEERLNRLEALMLLLAETEARVR